MPDWKDLFTTRDRRFYPDVVTPLARDTTYTASRDPTDTSGLNSTNAESLQAKGVAGAHATTQLTLDELRAEVEQGVIVSGHDSSYDRKAKIINRAIQDIGMGSYQWGLFVLCGFGWIADNLWLQGVALTLTPLSKEFGISETDSRFATCALFVGLIIGASFWGIASDAIGRRPAFNCTLFLCGAFGLAAGGAPNWVGTCALYSCLGLGVGGNMPVDAAIFCECLPPDSGNILSALATWWSVGTLIASMLAWAFIPNFSCADAATCTRADNWGWRYLVLSLGAVTFLMFLCRFFLFTYYESPKFLVARNRQDEAVAAVQGIARKNRTTTWLTEEVLNEIGGHAEEEQAKAKSTTEIITGSFERFSYQQILPLFASKRLGFSTILIWFCWTCIGMGYTLFNAFLPQYLGANSSTYETYRNYAITAVCGIPGPFLSWAMVDIPYIGRKGTMAISTCITAVLLFCFTATKDPNVQLVCSALESFFQMMMYGVLYAYTPEVFPAPNRGTATGIASCLNRIAGLMAPIIGIYASENPVAPIYAAGGLLLAAFVAMVFMPIETRGKQTV
ncbi:major facilitator superfamily domain-containing protein [Aspergillus avenaceus]|uniref:Major facilitator superfamily domain-containing protein n=1 Tax=Aspergillus avenaceus TaxID=36643 RepID=A0A5N6U9D8_ASPAV|nr:major facilitator superfamily domain-containing protein [Aspergillus avenaceus]